MGFACGIIGLPNVGKSTLLNALTQTKKAEAKNFPFCTIEPNTGEIPVIDPRLNKLAAIVKPQNIIPTSIKFVDIAGLVAGASKGEGLGNKFLAHIRETDAIAHVVRCFEDPNITHVSGKVSPLDDIEIIETELALADLSSVEKALQKVTKNSKSGNKEMLANKDCLNLAQQHLNQGLALRNLELSQEQQAILHSYNFITMKPMLYIANVDENNFANNPYLHQVEQLAKQQQTTVIAICAAIEAEIAELNPEEQQIFLTEMGMNEPGLNKVIQSGYNLLNLQTFFTAGAKEVRAWTVKVGATAPQAAGVIHTDFERGFIRAEVISFNDYIEHQGEDGSRKAGKLRVEGKSYVMRDADVVHFLFNV